MSLSGKQLFQLAILSFIPLLFFTCKANKNNGKNGGLCNTIGTVQDFSNLDGCGLLIVTEDGQKLAMVETPTPDFSLVANQKISFGYEKLEDRMSICMTEDAFIKITCIEILSADIPNKKECLKLDKHTDAKWMQNIVEEIRPVSVTRFAYRQDGWAYLFDNIDGTLLYDCQGNLVCQNKTWAECKAMTEPGSEEVVIYAGR